MREVNEWSLSLLWLSKFQETGKMNHSKPNVSAVKANLALGVGTIPSEVPAERAGEAGPRCSSVLPSALGSREEVAAEGDCERREPYTLAPNDPSNDGLSHHGEPEQEEEVIVLEEPREERQEGPRVVRVPRAPTQEEIDSHSATHLPHAEWCEFCMAGRGRNKPHKRKKEAPEEGIER